MPIKTSSTAKSQTIPPSRNRTAGRCPGAPTTSAAGDAAPLAPAQSTAVRLAPTPPTKSAIVRKLLARAKGATIAEIAEPTGWQPHSTRACLSGLRKKGLKVVREQRESGETTYRIVDAARANVDTAVPPAADIAIAAAPASDGTTPHDSDSNATVTGSVVLDDPETDTSPEVAATPEATA